MFVYVRDKLSSMEMNVVEIDILVCYLLWFMSCM